MGQEISSGAPADLEPMKRFQNMSPGQVRLIKEKFELMADEDLTIDRNGFQQLMKLKEGEVDRVFSFFDFSNDGRIDSHEFVCALSLLSQACLKDKASIIFSLYDFDHNKTITRNELVILIKTTLTALGAMTQKGECSIQEAEKIAEELLRKYDTNKDQSISLPEFQSLLSKDADVLKMLLTYGLCSVEDLRQDFGGCEQDKIPDPDSDLEAETERKGLAYDQKREKRKAGIDRDEEINKTQKNIPNWRNQIKQGQPSNWKPGKGDFNPPSTYIDLEHIYGFRSFDTRNNIKHVGQDIVYFTAAVGVIFNTQTNQQRFFFEHSDDITCIAVHDKLIATGQVGQIPTIYIWEAKDVIEPSKAALKGVLRDGIQALCFSNDGKKLAAVGMDNNIIIYDVDKSMNYRSCGLVSNSIIATGQGPNKFVFDIKFDKLDKYLILACRDEVNFCTYDQGSIRPQKGLWDSKTCPISSVLCIGLCENNIITGTFKGQLLIWKSNRATAQVDAHKGAVLALHTRSKEGGLLSGSKDGTIAIWDTNVKLKERIAIINYNLKILNLKVQSISENDSGSHIVFGTRGADIVEIQGTKSKVIMRGHSIGILRGLAMHPKSQQFYTIGEDNILACWLIKEKKLGSSIRLDYPSSAIHISKDCKYLAVGTTNGTVLIIDPKTLMATFNFKDRDAEVSCLKFSPETEYLAVGHDAPSCDILIYSIKNHFKRTNVLRGSPARVVSIDFSLNSRILQVNDWSQQVLYYEISGEGNQKVQPDGANRNRDEKWSTYTAIYGWHVQSVWPQHSSSSDINAVDRSNKGDIIVSADDYSSIKVFRYPASLTNQGYQRFIGHAAHVTMVRFSFDDQYLISLGGADKSIMQWKVTTDKEAQTEQDSACETIQDQQIPPEYLRLSLYDDEQKQDNQMKQYPGPVKALQPQKFDAAKANVLPDQNLILDYILGVKTQQLDQEYFNGVKLLQNGNVVFSCGAIAIIMDPNPQIQGKQYKQSYFKYLQEEISSIAVHPNGNVVAVGTKAFGLQDKYNVSICVWEADTKKVLAHLQDFHTRIVYCVEFSCDGIYLFSSSDEYSIAIHDWQLGQLIATIKTVKSPIYAIVSKSTNEFMSCGLKSVTFHYINGRNVKSIPGNLSGGQFETMLCCCSAFKDYYFSGSINGNIFLWRDTQSQKQYKAHNGKVSSLIGSERSLYSAGMDGKVLEWQMNGNNLNQTRTFVDMINNYRLQNCGIIGFHSRNDYAIVCTQQAQIFWSNMRMNSNTTISLQAQQIAPPTLNKILDAHYDGEVWGVGVSNNSQTIITCGGDSKLRIWDINTYQLVTVSAPFDNDIRACDWSSDGQFLIVADIRGFIYLLDPTNCQIHDKKGSKFAAQKSVKLNNWIEEIKFSPDSKKIAFGAHGMASQVEVWEIESQKLVRQSLISVSLNGSLLKIDWAVDSNHLMINSSSYELKFVNVSKAKDIPAPQAKDLEWYTCTCLFGFDVQGIYKEEEYKITQVCSDHQKQIIAVGESNGLLNLYKYPAWQQQQVHKEYYGHGNAITKIRFSYNDNKLITTSGLDRGIFIWRIEQLEQELQQQQQLQQQQLQQIEQDDIFNIGIVNEKIKRFGADKYGKVRRREMTQLEQNEAEIFKNEPLDKGDEFTVIRPWMGVIKEPSYYYKDQLNQNKIPKIELILDHVHGYRVKDQRNNVKYLKGGQIVYNAAALAIIADPNNQTNVNQIVCQQKFFNQHTDDVIAIDVSNDSRFVATGEIGIKPKIFVWESNTQQIIFTLKGQLTKGIIQLAFNSNGDKLAAIGMDDKHQIIIYDIGSRSGGIIIAQDYVGIETITDIKWKNEFEFVTCGLNHLSFWKLQDSGLSRKRSIPQKQLSTKYLCAAINAEEYVIGALDGTIQIFKDNKFATYYQYLDNNRILEAISISKDFILLGGRDNRIIIVDAKNYKQILAFKLSESIKGSLNLEIKSIQLGQDAKTILVATNTGDIYELSTKDAKINTNSKFTLSKTIVRSHYCPNKRSLNEIWGLAVNPQDSDQYYTCGDDGTLRSWSISRKTMLNMVKTNLDQNGNEIKIDEMGDLPDSIKGRSIAVSQDGISILVGFKDGTVRQYDKEFKQIMVQKLAKEWISDIKFSHDSTLVALGSHDSSIYIYNFPDMKLRHKPLKKHSSYITHLDFSTDSNHLHSNDGSYELLFWDVQQGKQLPSGGNNLRDEKWLTWSTPLGWPVQGIWPEFQNGSDINAAVRSNNSFSDKPPDNYYLIATGDDNSQIKLFRYPCVKKGSQYILGKGHSSHISNLTWSTDDHFLFSTGGEDNCVFQWKIIKNI